MNQYVDEFKEFVLRGNVVDLAVGVVVGAAFASVVQALVKGILTPLIGMAGGVPDASAWTVTANGSVFLVGEVVNAVLSFLLIAAAVYFLVVVPVNRLLDRTKAQEPAAPKTRDCPFCLSKIPTAATRCAFCTSEVPVGTSPVTAPAATN